MLILNYNLITISFEVVEAPECSGSLMSNGSGYTASWEIVEDEITFTLSALTLGWVGIGFSFDEMMVCLHLLQNI